LKDIKNKIKKIKIWITLIKKHQVKTLYGMDH